MEMIKKTIKKGALLFGTGFLLSFFLFTRNDAELAALYSVIFTVAVFGIYTVATGWKDFRLNRVAIFSNDTPNKSYSERNSRHSPLPIDD